MVLGKLDRCRSCVGSDKNNLPAMQEAHEIWILSLGHEDSLEEEMVTHSSILA